MNRLIKICAISIAVVWIFCIGLVVGSFGVRNKMKKELLQSNTQPTSQQTLPPETQPTTSGTSQIVIDMVTNQSTTAPPTTLGDITLKTEASSGAGAISTFAEKTTAVAETPADKLPSGNAEIAKALVDAINATKATQNFSAKKTEKLDVTVDEASGGTQSVVDSYVKKQLDKPDTNCTFVDGVDTSGSGKTPTALIAPLNKMASLDESAIQSAEVTAGTNGAYSVEVVLKPEQQTLNQGAKNHDGIFETIDINSLGLPSNATITELYINYSGATVKAQINKSGKLDSITYVLPVTEGGGNGKMIIPVTIKMHGQYDCTVTCTY